MKTILYTFLFALLCIPAAAQKNLFSYGVDLVIPQNEFVHTAKTGLGTSFRYERVLKDRLTAMITVSGMFFGKKTVSSSGPPPMSISTKSILYPIQAGLRYFVIQKTPTSGLFATGELGIHVLTAKGWVNENKVDIDTETGFSYALGLGYRFNDYEVAYRLQFIQDQGVTINYSNIRVSLYLFNHRN